MYKVLLILCIPFLNFSQETIQDLLELGVHSAFETKNQSHIRHFESSNYKLLISEKSHVIQIGIWKNDDINAAIASIKWGRNWGDTAQATAYKTCNYGGYLD